MRLLVFIVFMKMVWGERYFEVPSSARAAWNHFDIMNRAHPTTVLTSLHCWTRDNAPQQCNNRWSRTMIDCGEGVVIKHNTQFFRCTAVHNGRWAPIAAPVPSTLHSEFSDRCLLDVGGNCCSDGHSWRVPQGWQGVSQTCHPPPPTPPPTLPPTPPPPPTPTSRTFVRDFFYGEDFKLYYVGGPAPSGYSWNRWNALRACSHYGLGMASIDHLHAAHRAGAERCTAGHVIGTSAAWYPMQTARAGCGNRVGVNQWGSSEDLRGAWCVSRHTPRYTTGDPHWQPPTGDRFSTAVNILNRGTGVEKPMEGPWGSYTLGYEVGGQTRWTPYRAIHRAMFDSQFFHPVTINVQGQDHRVTRVYFTSNATNYWSHFGGNGLTGHFCRAWGIVTFNVVRNEIERRVRIGPSVFGKSIRGWQGIQITLAPQSIETSWQNRALSFRFIELHELNQWDRCMRLV